MAKLGILGGTFDPPHIGHLVLAQEAKEQLGLDKVFFIPAYRSPHKGEDCLSSDLRLKLVKFAIAGSSGFKALDIEIKRKEVSYTIDTIFELKRIYPEDILFLIIGSDLVDNFIQWKEPDKIKKMAKVVVAEREGIPLVKENNFSFIGVTQIGVSSSMIRQKIRENKSIKCLVPERVEEFIRENNLYK